MASAGLTYALNNGMTADQYYQNIFDFVAQNQGMSPADLRSAMDQYGISTTDVAQATGTNLEAVQQLYDAVPVTAPEPVYTPEPAPNLLETAPEAPTYVEPTYVEPTYVEPTYVEPAPAYVAPAPVTAPVGLLETPVEQPVAAPVTAPVGLLEIPVEQPVTAPVVAPVAAPVASAALTYALNNGSTEEQYHKQILDAFEKAKSQGLSDAQIEIGMNQYGISAGDLAQATGVTPESVQARMDVATPTTAADLAYEKAAQEELATRQAQEDARLASLIAPVETAPVVTPPVVPPVVPPIGLLETPVTPPVVASVTAPVGLLETPVTAPVAAPVTAPVGLLESPVVTPPVTTGSNMATSAALNYALNNGMTQAQFDKRIFDAVLAAQQPGSTTTNAMLRSEMDRLGISTEDVARATGVSTQSVQEKYNVALPKTNAELIADAAAKAELAARTARDTTASAATIAAARQAATTSQGLLGATDQTAATAAAATLAAQQKAAADAQAVINAKAAADAKAAAALKTKTTATTTTQTGLNAQLEKAYKDGDIALLNSLLAQNQVTSAQAKNMFNLTDADLSWIQNNAGGKFYTPPTATPPTATPGANMGIGGSFANFQSIPIGAQFNPAVTAGGASPYSQIMGQMKPFTNPYQNFVANTPMGGYDPGLYDKIEAANLAKAQADAEISRLGGIPVSSAGGSDAGGGGGVGGTGGVGGAGGPASTTAANAADMGAVGDDGDDGGDLARGGYVHGGLMFGPDPAGPDDGAVNLDMGEYVIRKSSVNKYGRGLLDMINEGKVPAKKMKSLLG